MMKPVRTHRVIVYHDETKDVPGEDLKGHVLLFVPETSTTFHNNTLFGTQEIHVHSLYIFAQHIEKLRAELKCQDKKFHFSEISGKKWSKYDEALFKLNCLNVEAMRTKGVSKLLDKPLFFKLAVMFYPKNADINLYGGDDNKEKRLRYDETILRILLKGAAHFLYSDEDKLEVLRLICDGQPEHRPFSDDRIFWQLLVEEESGRTPLRDYVNICPQARIEHILSDHKQHESSSEEYMHANLLQVADILLGSVRYIFFGDFKDIAQSQQIGRKCEDKRSVIAKPVWEMLKKKSERGRRFRYSGHYKAFTVSRMKFEKGRIIFQELNIPEARSQSDDLPLF